MVLTAGIRSEAAFRPRLGLEYDYATGTSDPKGAKNHTFDPLFPSQHPNQGYALQDILLDLLGEFAFPILFGFSTGHTSRPNVIVPFGVRARLALGTSARFELLEPAVV